MSSTHPRTVFIVDQAASTCPSFLVNMSSFHSPYMAVFGLKTVSMIRNRWRSIYCCSVDPPWQVEMKSSR